jgi:vacuolar-type H+-ATPase subunit H
MSKPLIRIHNTETDEVIDREMTAAEFKIYEAEQKAQEIRKAEAEAKETQRQALLSRLGITEEEARILLGGN